TDHYYYIVVFNVCGVESAQSGKHHTINLTVTNGDLLSALKWNHYKGFAIDHYEIEKSVDGSPLMPAFKLSATDTLFTDTNVFCKHVYSYRIHAFGKNGLESYSDSETVTAADISPPRKADIHVANVAAT